MIASFIIFINMILLMICGICYYAISELSNEYYGGLN